MYPTPIKPHKDSIYLYGPSGSGKTSVGRLLAENLSLPFLDLDDAIENETGLSIPMIFEQEGESGFRSREAQALIRATKTGGVIALGGGALTTQENRDLALASGTVIVLHADRDNLASRLAGDKVERPLLSGDSDDRLQAYLEQRAPHYASFSISVDTTDKTPQQVALKVRRLLGMYHLRAMASHIHPPYDLRICPKGLDSLGEMMAVRNLRSPVVVGTDENVQSYYLTRALKSLEESDFITGMVTIPPGENFKTMATVTQLWQAFLSYRVERSSTVLALGGGVVGDLVGFAAATYLRGVPWVSIPTSLLAMVDAGLGGKTGADLPQGKNLVGAFHPPRLVLVDPELLTTLPQVEFINGMAEVVKHGVIGDPGLLLHCRKNISQFEQGELFELLNRAIAVKVGIIEEDPYEQGIRVVLNYGHTVGHGLELASGFRLRHGEAVAIGMVVEAEIAEAIGLAENGLAQAIGDILQSLGLPISIPNRLHRDAITQAMRRDKKTAGNQLKFSLPVRIGKVEVGVEVNDWERYIKV